MLDPQQRTVLREALTPPAGYTFNEGIGTTYTLDLISLLSTHLAFTPFECEDAQGEPSSNRVLQLEALRRHAGGLTLFCHAGRIALPARPSPLFAYLEESVVQVTTGQHGGVFHPKVWVLRYSNATGDVRYRFICLTRNLTDDRSWDLSLVLEGPLVARKKAFAANHPLGAFIEALPALAVPSGRGVTAEVRQRVERLAGEIRRVDFASELPRPFESVAFIPIGIEGHRRWPLPDGWDRGLVVSPFLDQSLLERIGKGSKRNVLVSRPDELDRMPPVLLKGFAEVLELSPAAEGEFEPGLEPEEDGVAEPRGLHAKLYVCDTGWDSHLFMGSANATSAAYKENVEFLVELVGKKSKIGVEEILSGGEGQASLRSLLMPYDPPTEPSVVDPVVRQLDDLLNSVRSGMAEAGWRFVAQGPEQGPWRLGLTRTASLPFERPAGTHLRVWPLTLPGNALDLGANAAEFGEVGAATLTSFLACEARATIGAASAVARFVLNLPLEGAPTGRREALLRSVLDDSGKVLRFLQFLLDDGDQVQPSFRDEPTHSGDGAGAGPGRDASVLLEALLRALVRNPTVLDEIAGVLRELGDDAEARKRLPQGLLDIWPAIWAARQAASS